jgi:hypothetical protein
MFVQSKESPRIDFLKAVQTSYVPTGDSLDLDCGPRVADHEHAATLAHLDGLVVHVNPDDRVGAHLLWLGYHLPHRCLPRRPQGSLVTSVAASHYVPQATEEVPEDAGPENFVDARGRDAPFLTA